jgi:aminoglycoside phosphotransferase (APT) family kinase protein
VLSDAQWPTATALAWVPGLRDGAAPQRIERLLGGSVNESWRVDTAEGCFVLRIDGPEWRRPGVDRAREQLLHEAAGGAGLAPRLLLRADTDGLQVCEYLEGCSWSELDFLQPPQLRRLGERLAQLHALDVPAGILPFDPVGCARQYLKAMSDRAAAAPRTVELVGQIDAAARRVADGTVELSIVHGDLAHANVLDGTRLWLLDWEYAQRADPLYDVACALAYYPQAQPQAAELLAAAGLIGAGIAARLEPAIRVYDGLSRLWHWARASPRSA